MGTEWQGAENRHNSAIELNVLRERVDHLIDDNNRDHNATRDDILQLRQQTDAWMKIVTNHLPPWAVVIGSLMSSGLAAMAMYLMTHK